MINIVIALILAAMFGAELTKLRTCGPGERTQRCCFVGFWSFGAAFFAVAAVGALPVGW